MFRSALVDNFCFFMGRKKSTSKGALLAAFRLDQVSYLSAFAQIVFSPDGAKVGEVVEANHIFFSLRGCQRDNVIQMYFAKAIPVHSTLELPLNVLPEEVQSAS